MDPPTVLKVLKYWMKVAVSLQLCLLPALLDLLHNRGKDSTYNGLPEEPTALYNLLLKFKANKKKKLKNVLKNWQWDNLCPTSCQTNSENFDVTTIIVLITNLINLPPPTGGWKIKETDPRDQSISAFVFMARAIRNEIFHCSDIKSIDEKEFEKYWLKIRNILVGLGYQNIVLFDGLKNSSLDEYRDEQVSAMETRQSELESEVENMKQTFQCKRMKIEGDIDCHSQEIQLLKESIQQLTPCSSTNSFTNVYIFNNSNSAEWEDVYDEDIELLSNTLKKNMEERYAHITQKTAALKPKSQTPDRIARESIVVDVSLKKTIQESCERSLVHSAHDYNNIVSCNKTNIILSGEPGIGKSTLAETMLYNWSQNKVWNGANEEDPDFKFVFILNFCELNRYASNKKITAKKMLKREFTEIFDRLKLKTLRKMKDKVMLMLEGFDECCNIEELSNSSRSNFGQAIYDLINPENSELPFKRILTSRPDNCFLIVDTFDRCCFKIYEITGFSKDSIERYIRMYFSSDSSQIQSIQAKIQSSKLLSAIIHVPFYCWGVCCLFNDTQAGEIPETYTSLYAHLLLLFLRDHGQPHQKTKHKRLEDVLESHSIQDIILVIAKLAFSTLVEKKFTFTKDDFETRESRSRIKAAELALKSGLLVKRDSDTSESYTFLHVTFHEFLAAVYILHKGLSILHCKAVHEIDSTVLPLLAGLLGGLSQSSRSGQLVKRYAKVFHHKSIGDRSIECLLDDYLQTPNTNRTRMFLSCVYEYHNPFLYKKPVNLFGDFRNEFDYKRLCLEHLAQSLSRGDISIDNIVLFYDDNMWSAIIPYIKKVTLHVMPSSECLLSSLPFDILAAFRDNTLKLRKLKVLQNIGLDYIFEFLPFIESVEIVGYVEDLRVLRSILSNMDPVEIELQKLKFHLTEECDVHELVDLATYIDSFQVVVRGNTSTNVHICTSQCIKSSTVQYLKTLYDCVDLNTSSTSLGILRNFRAGASCWFESEDSNYIYLITSYDNFAILDIDD